MGQGHKKMGVNAISITYKKEEVLIIGGSVRSLSDDPYAEHRIFQHFNPTFILVDLRKTLLLSEDMGISPCASCRK